MLCAMSTGFNGNNGLDAASSFGVDDEDFFGMTRLFMKMQPFPCSDAELPTSLQPGCSC